MKRILSLILCSSLLSGCKPNNEPITQKEFCLDTVVSITLYDSSSKKILNNCFDLCKKYELIFSTTNTSSELYQINHNKNKTQYQTISNELASVIKQGLYYSELSHGAFDITIGAVSSLWDFKSDKVTLPNETLIKENLKTVNYQNIICDHKKILYKNPNTIIDLGAIAKGYIADKLKEYLIQHKVNNALINLGGNILCVGDKMTEGYRIGITNPQKTDESIISTKIENKSVVTSGIYQRQMKVNHHVYHHILNPRTGYSYDNGLASVTIVSPSSMQGDALSTVCFSLGLEKGKALIESLDDVEACFIDTNNQITYTTHFKHS